MKILGFWHIADYGNWRIITPGQWWKLGATGLLAATERLHVFKVGGTEDELRIGTTADPYFNAPHIKEHPLVSYQHHPNRELFEFPTLQWMQDCALTHPEPFYAYYFHVKGAGTACHQTRSPAFWWKEYMEHHIISGWRRCVTKLDEGYDIVGCDIRFAPSLHFSGNFFWTTSQHLKKLPPMNAYYEKHKAERPRDHRIAAEMWIGMENPKYFELQRNGPWHGYYNNGQPTGQITPQALTGQDMYHYPMTPDLWK